MTNQLDEEKGLKPSTWSVPVRQLIQTLTALAILLVIAGLCIGAIKRVLDRRFVDQMTDNTISNMTNLSNAGRTAEAEDALLSLLLSESAEADRIAWAFVDSLVVMPRLEGRLKAVADELSWTATGPNAGSFLRRELALRRGQFEVLLSTPAATGEQPGAPLAYAWWATIESQRFDRASNLGTVGEAVAPIPRDSLLVTVSPLRLYTALSGDSPDDDRSQAALAFYEGRWMEVKALLEQGRRDGTLSSNQAYFLGAVAESEGELEAASRLYGQALSTGDEHVEAARAYVRVAGG